MSVSLKDVLTSSTTDIQKINVASKGGTFIQFKCHRVHVPGSCKKEWGCVWFEIKDAFDATNEFYYDYYFTDQECGGLEISEDYRTVMMIFRETPYIFLHDYLDCPYEDVLRFDHRVSDAVYSISRISFGRFEFEEKSNQLQSFNREEVRNFFAKALTHAVPSYAVEHNKSLLERYRWNEDAFVQKELESFNLEKFYYERIGESTKLTSELTKKITLRPQFFVNRVFDRLSKKKRTPAIYRALEEKFAI